MAYTPLPWSSPFPLPAQVRLYHGPISVLLQSHSDKLPDVHIAGLRCSAAPGPTSNESWGFWEELED